MQKLAQLINITSRNQGKQRHSSRNIIGQFTDMKEPEVVMVVGVAIWHSWFVGWLRFNVAKSLRIGATPHGRTVHNFAHLRVLRRAPKSQRITTTTGICLNYVYQASLAVSVSALFMTCPFVYIPTHFQRSTLVYLPDLKKRPISLQVSKIWSLESSKSQHNTETMRW